MARRSHDVGESLATSRVCQFVDGEHIVTVVYGMAHDRGADEPGAPRRDQSHSTPSGPATLSNLPSIHPLNWMGTVVGGVGHRCLRDYSTGEIIGSVDLSHWLLEEPPRSATR